MASNAFAKLVSGEGRNVAVPEILSSLVRYRDQLIRIPVAPVVGTTPQPNKKGSELLPLSLPVYLKIS
jgi:hypothetical protein